MGDLHMDVLVFLTGEVWIVVIDGITDQSKRITDTQPT